MTVSSKDSEEQRSRSRIPLLHPVRIRYRLFQEFIQEVSSNISTGGMFIATSDLHEPGARFEFELALDDGFPLVKGQAEVVWVRAESAGLAQPVGMGVRFVELEGASRSLVAKIVDKHRKKGRQPFDLESESALPLTAAEPLPAPAVGATVEKKAPPREPPGESPREPPGESPGESAIKPRVDLMSPGVLAETIAELRTDELARAAPALPPPSAMSPSPDRVMQRRRTPRFLLLSAIAIAAGLLIVVLFNYLYVRPRIDDLERRLESLSAPGAGARETGEPEADDESELAPAALIEESTVDTASPLETVQEWARAWSEQRIDDYLAAYSPDFEPTGELSREMWEDLRRKRILGGSEIRVQVLLAEETELGPEERIVSFVQAYRSSTYRDRVRKTLRFLWEDGGWKIVEERVVRALPE